MSVGGEGEPAGPELSSALLLHPGLPAPQVLDDVEPVGDAGAAPQHDPPLLPEADGEREVAFLVGEYHVQDIRDSHLDSEVLGLKGEGSEGSSPVN